MSVRDLQRRDRQPNFKTQSCYQYFFVFRRKLMISVLSKLKQRVVWKWEKVNLVFYIFYKIYPNLVFR